MSCSCAARTTSSSWAARSPDPRSERPRQVGHVVKMAIQLRLALLQHLHERVAGLASDGCAAAVALLLVEPLVGQVERRRHVGGLLRHDHQAVGTAHREAAAAVGEGRAGLGRQLHELAGRAVRDHAEFIAAEAVCPTGLAHGLTQPPPEAREQGIADRVAEAVVVLLEAIEVEHRQPTRVLGSGLGNGRHQVGHQPAPVGQPRERVGAGLALSALDQFEVLAEGERHPDDGHGEGGQCQHQRGDGKRVHRVNDQQAE